jgi:aldehyde:ferredoxin oxidoreductase
MARGYREKILFINLSTGEIRQETPGESLYRDFIGGYGIGARILYSRQKGGIDPLGPENTLGFLTGPLTGTGATFAGRYGVVAKSPLTGGWGDSNSGGHFGPYLKFSGYDAVFFAGIAASPVYLFLNDGKAELKDASHLWGKDCFVTEDTLKAELGEEVEVSCIGPSGEKLSLIACIVNRRGAVAGRSGLGAVMGSKKLKAIAAAGKPEVAVFDLKKVNRLRQEHVAAMRKSSGMETLEGFHKYGTSHVAEGFAHSGNTPVKNWGGVGVIDFPDASGLSGDAAIANLERRTGCWHCPVGCEGRLKAGAGEYKYPAGTRRVEYETQAAFGTMCCNGNTESLNMVNHLCNSYGLDTISGGTTMAFAIECYENGIITKADTDGIELGWGNHRGIVAMTEKMVRREGFGDVLADGVRAAAEKIGRGAEAYAVHIGGQELGMHDPKFPSVPDATSAARYQMDATPGRHTQMNFGPAAFTFQLVNATGWCMFSDLVGGNTLKYITAFMSAVTGWDRSEDELLKAGERIYNMRHVFNLREGINPIRHKIHGRIIGRPPQKEGPLAGSTADIEAQVYWGLGALDWSRATARPSRKKLLELGLNDVAEELWPPQPGPGPGH